MTIEPIAHYRCSMKSKFGLPKQSGLVESLRGMIVFEKKYRSADYLREIDGFDYLWLLWHFSANQKTATSPMVRPPLLGGNKKVGVFASRSPFRPNPIGLSSVKLERVEWESSRGPLLYVGGADLLDGTPIFDIKPYLEYADCHTGVRSGFVDVNPIKRLNVVFYDSVRKKLDNETIETIGEMLALDPRPHYQHDADRLYIMDYGNMAIRFRVDEDVVYVLETSEVKKIR